MLATAGPLPDGPGWAFEFGWDGIRSLVDVSPDGVRVLGGDSGGGGGEDGTIAARCPELDVLPALAGRRRILLDGTLVALDAWGRPDSSRLQLRMNASTAARRRVPVAYYVVDVLRLDGHSTLQLPYRQRRRLLEQLNLAGGPIALPPSFVDVEGQAVLDTAAQYGLHAVIAKRADSTYQPGRRSRSWVETALRRTQEVVVGGWVPGSRGLRSLLVGVPTERGLAFAGQVGTGFTDAERRHLPVRLSDLERQVSPFLDALPPDCARGARWVAPELLGEVAYRRWTPRGRLGHPTWQGLRPGKHVAAVQGPVVLRPRSDTVAEDPADLDEAVRRARAEVDGMRAQISPHFLYNALSAIAALVRTDPSEARELLTDFAHFTRYCFRPATDVTTLADELENVERYLALEQARLGDRLRVELRVSPAVLPVALPLLAVQREIERAVQSIEDTPTGGTVTVHAGPDGADCVIRVGDDGVSGTVVRLRAPLS